MHTNFISSLVDASVRAVATALRDRSPVNQVLPVVSRRPTLRSTAAITKATLVSIPKLHVICVKDDSDDELCWQYLPAHTP
jgi:hypothetical protein